MSAASHFSIPALLDPASPRSIVLHLAIALSCNVYLHSSSPIVVLVFSVCIATIACNICGFRTSVFCL